MERRIAEVRNEGTDERSWFIYVRGTINASSYATRYNSRVIAERVARAMNAGFEEEGSLLTNIFSEGVR